MRPLTTTTMTTALRSAGPDVPQYSYAGEGRFLPANAAAIEECRRFNAWVDEVNARARGGITQ